MDSNNHSRIICNTCKFSDASPVIHCSVCCSAFHYKCTFPEVPVSTFEHLAKMSGMQWICPSDRELTVSKLLDQLSLMERKLMERPSTFDESLCGGFSNTQSAQTQTSPVQEPTTTRRILRSTRGKRNATSSNDVVPEKRSKAPKISKPPSPPELMSDNLNSIVTSPKNLVRVPQSQSTSQVKAPIPTPQNTSELATTTPLEVVPSRPKEKLPEVKATMPTPQNTSEPTTAVMLEVVSSRPEKKLPVANEQGSLENMLAVVPPNRSIFLSRLAIETSVEDIKKYISEKLSITSDFGIRKFDLHGAKYSSFLLRCEDSIYEPLIDSKNWPRHMRVEKFFHRRSRRSHQP